MSQGLARGHPGGPWERWGGRSSCLVRLAEVRPKTPEIRLFSRSSWHKASRPPCHPPLEAVTELKETVVPIWGNSRCISLPSFPPGLWPLSTMGRGLNFLHQSPGLLDLRTKRMFCGYFFTFCFKLCWNGAGFIPRENCPLLCQKNGIKLKAGDCFSWRS